MHKLRNNIIYLSLALSLFTTLRAASLSGWEKTGGPPGGTAYAVERCGGYIFSGTDFGVFRSSDNGITWQQTAMTKAIKCLASSDTNGVQYIFAGYAEIDNKGIYRSSDWGNSWVQILNTGVLAIGVKGPTVFISVLGGVLKSTNFGNTWFQSSSSFYALSFAINYPDVFASSYAGVFHSSDFGLSWSQILFVSAGTYSIAVSGQNVYAGGSSYVYVSSNNGVNWNNSPLYGSSASVYSIVIRNSKVYIGAGDGTGGGILFSINNGQTWFHTGFPENKTVYSLLESGNGLGNENDSLIAGTYEYGVYFSSDAGSSWRQNSLANQIVPALTCVGNLLYAGTLTKGANSGTGIFLSRDDGLSWFQTTLNNRLVISMVTFIAEVDTVILAGTINSSSLLRSSNNGQNWISVLSPGIIVNSFLNSVLDSNSKIFAATDHGLYASTNYGLNWNQTSLMPLNGVKALTKIGQSVFAGTNGYNSLPCLYISRDNTLTWSNSNLNDSITIYSMASYVDGTDTVVLAGTSAGIYRSTNNGASWFQTFFNNHRVYALNVYESGTAKYIFAGTDSNGVYFSSDNAVNWLPINIGLGILRVKSLTIKDNYLYAGTEGSSVWRLKLSDVIGIKPIDENVSEAYKLKQNYPNPFNPSTIIEFSVPKTGLVKLTIYNILGETVANLVYAILNSGSYSVEFNAEVFCSGIYFYSLEFETGTISRKMVILK